MVKMTCLTLLGLASQTWLAPIVLAQYWSGLKQFSTPQAALVDRIITDHVFTVDPRTDTKSNTRNKPLTITDFTRSAPRRALTAAIAAQFATAFGLKAADQFQFVAAVEQSTNSVETASTVRRDNVAYGLAVLIATATEIDSGQKVSATQTALYARYINDNWAIVLPQGSTPAAKQDLYDRFLTLTGLLKGLAGPLSQLVPHSHAQAKELAHGTLSKYVGEHSRL